ncbi:MULTISPECIES: hypothetical protein [Pseudomonas]|uniref:Adhesin n=1 Tax=Pseudomonas promysalinigenes TaxID=485898 RepID=A0ABY6AFI3_9PSED|nr:MULTISPECIES: hypothetical protein [Pseudomonas]UXH37858.1 hypothetical protein N5C08_12675 [Pseudomonas promysalinigenes]
MGKLDRRVYGLLLITCAMASALPAQADNGIIVITRDVQPRIATRAPLAPDPYPTTANANPSAYVLRQTNELSDGDFASITSGTGISSLVTQQTDNLGGPIGNQTQLANQAAGRGTGSGNGISNMVNSSVQRGLAPLQILTGGK